VRPLALAIVLVATACAAPATTTTAQPVPASATATATAAAQTVAPTATPRPKFPHGLYFVRPSLQHPGGTLEVIEADAPLPVNVEFFGTGGRSEENRSLGFRPAFMDRDTLAVYPACFADGRPAPFHLLEGLPAEVVLTRNAQGRVATVKATIVAGFTLDGEFYTRDAAARKASELN